jgi:hypothetical protein
MLNKEFRNKITSCFNSEGSTFVEGSICGKGNQVMLLWMSCSDVRNGNKQNCQNMTGQQEFSMGSGK